MNMQELKHALDGLSRFVDVRQPVLYLDYSVYLNFGDILIMLGTERFFAEHGYEVSGRYSCMNFPEQLQRAVTKGTTIVMQGGGNFGDLYPTYQRFRERIVRAFPEHRVVVLPQSLHFSSHAALERSAAVFREHPALVLLARDEVSHRLMQTHFSPNSYLMPDMAHQLWPAARDAAPSRDTLHFLRTDKEAGLGLVPTPLNERLSFDWSGLIANSQHRSFRRILADHHREGRTGQFRGAHLAWYAYCENLYEHLSAIFVQYEAVVTNRLHAMIFARLLGRRAAYIDNYYGKLSRYADLWLSGQHELSALARPSRA